MSPKEAIVELRRYFPNSWNVQVSCKVGEYAPWEGEHEVRPYVTWDASVWERESGESHRTSWGCVETLERAVDMVTGGRILLPVSPVDDSDAESFFANAERNTP